MQPRCLQIVLITQSLHSVLKERKHSTSVNLTRTLGICWKGREGERLLITGHPVVAGGVEGGGGGGVSCVPVVAAGNPIIIIQSVTRRHTTVPQVG